MTNPEILPPGVDARAADWGLCRVGYERDSCGFGLIANLDDQASHWLVETAISSLNRLTHRGAIAADGKTGDGCGLLIKSTDAVSARGGGRGRDQADLPLRRRLVFLNPDPQGGCTRAVCSPRSSSVRNCASRDFGACPPIRRPAAPEALKTLPAIVQVFVNAGGDIDEATLNRKLYHGAAPLRKGA